MHFFCCKHIQISFVNCKYGYHGSPQARTNSNWSWLNFENFALTSSTPSSFSISLKSFVIQIQAKISFSVASGSAKSNIMIWSDTHEKKSVRFVHWWSQKLASSAQTDNGILILSQIILRRTLHCFFHKKSWTRFYKSLRIKATWSVLVYHQGRV